MVFVFISCTIKCFIDLYIVGIYLAKPIVGLNVCYIGVKKDTFPHDCARCGCVQGLIKIGL